jgi:hypothetical protein
MLGLADSNDPTPPIRWNRGGLWSNLAPLVGIGWLVLGAIRIGSSFWEGLAYLGVGAVFIAIGVLRLAAWRREVSRRRAPGSDGGTAPRP